MKGNHQTRAEKIGQKVGKALAWVVIVSPVFLMVALLMLNSRVSKLEEQVYQLQGQTGYLEERLESLERVKAKAEVQTGGEVPREPNAPGSTVTMEDLYPPTEEELTILAKIVYREARGIPDKAHQAAVIWCILNRVDDGYWGDTIAGVATYPHAFAWVPDTPVEQEFLLLAADVCERWNLEKAGASEVGRVLPKEYLYFTGYGGLNHFTTEWKGTEAWDWSLESPY